MDEEALLKQFAAQFAHGPDDADDTDAAAAAQGADSTANQVADDADQSPATFDTQQFLNGLDAIFDRHTAATEAGARGTSAYYEAIAKQRGVSVDALKPYLSQLDAAAEKQRAATKSMDGLGMSAGQTAMALRNVPAQMTDIFVSLQSGQKPMTVLLQQGGQVKDSFGGIMPTFRALGSLITPVRLAMGSVGPTILRAPEAESVAARMLFGAEPTSARADLLVEFERRASAAVSPIDDQRSTADYRRHAVGVIARRLLDRASREMP